MSRERARRRAEREAEAARKAEEARQHAAKLAARHARKDRIRTTWRKIIPWAPGQRRGRTRGQYGVIAAVLIAVFALVWLNTDSWGPRIMAALLAVLITPAVVTLALDRSR